MEKDEKRRRSEWLGEEEKGEKWMDGNGEGTRKK